MFIPRFPKIQPVTLDHSILNGSRIDPLPPHVQPPYYAAIIAAEVIGSTGSAKIIELDVNATDIAGYAVFEHGRLVRAVFINLAAYFPGGGDRKSTHINISLSGSRLVAQTVTVKRLDIPYGGPFLSISLYLIPLQICECDLRDHLGRANIRNRQR